jgi:hemolysin type calcium-binding protein
MEITRRTTLVGVFAVAAVLVSAVSAATIVGTSHADVLRGTAKADRLTGRAGNDKLYGLAGNDVLIGGPGADLLACGSGADMAVADAKDTVRGDCEVVKGLATPPPPPAPVPPPPPPPPRAKPRDGHYAGQTSQLEELTFDVSGGGTTVTNLRFKRNESCQPPNPGGGSSGPSGYITAAGPLSVAGDGTWLIVGTGQYALGAGVFTAAVRGTLDTVGRSRGTLRVDSVLADGRTCTTGDQTWTAAIP